MSDWPSPGGGGRPPGGHPPNPRDAQPGRGTPLDKPRRKWPWYVAGAVVLLVIIGAAEGSNKKTPPKSNASSIGTAGTRTTVTSTTTTSTTGATATTTAPTTTAPQSPHIGQVAKDGDFAFTVTSVQCGLTHLGSTTTGFSVGETAESGTQWCLVSMHVLNDKTSSQSFWASNQYAIDPLGRQLSATTGALLYVPHGSTAEFSTVNPGVSITVTVPFRLSSSDSIAKFILHDSAFSGGVAVYNFT